MAVSASRSRLLAIFGWLAVALIVGGCCAVAMWVQTARNAPPGEPLDFVETPQGVVTAITNCYTPPSSRSWPYLSRPMRCSVTTDEKAWANVPIGLLPQGVRVGDEMMLQESIYQRQKTKHLCLNDVCIKLSVCHDWMPCWTQ